MLREFSTIMRSEPSGWTSEEGTSRAREEEENGVMEMESPEVAERGTTVT